jgi:hypothetical protein
MTRERCERLLSKLARLITHFTRPDPKSPQPSHHPWITRSDIQLRLLEYLARQGTQDQFLTLLHTHLHHHPTTGPKLARIMLLGARRFESLSGNGELMQQMLRQLEHQSDQRPIIDFILRPNQPLSTLSANLEICLASLPAQREPRMLVYSHLLYRCSQLATPSLALKVWHMINSQERRRCLIRVGRRSRAKLKQMLSCPKTDPLAVTNSPDQLPHQAIRSMIYVYRNLTHASALSSRRRSQLAVGKNYRVLYQRLALKNSHRARWPLSRAQARSLLISHLVKRELCGDGVGGGVSRKMRGYGLLRAMERAFVGRGRGAAGGDMNAFEGLLRFLLGGKIRGAEMLLMRRLAHLDRASPPPPSPIDPHPHIRPARPDHYARFFRLLRLWARSRGGLTPAHRPAPPFPIPSPPPPASSATIVLDPPSAHHPPLPFRPRKRRACSRFWANVVALHSSSSS